MRKGLPSRLKRSPLLNLNSHYSISTAFQVTLDSRRRPSVSYTRRPRQNLPTVLTWYVWSGGGSTKVTGVQPSNFSRYHPHKYGVCNRPRDTPSREERWEGVSRLPICKRPFLRTTTPSVLLRRGPVSVLTGREFPVYSLPSEEPSEKGCS